MTPGETVCPTDYGKIHCGESCSNAMTKLGYAWDSSSEIAESYGCYFDPYTNTGYFNAPRKDGTLVCMANDIVETCPPTKAPTTGEPTSDSSGSTNGKQLKSFKSGSLLYRKGMFEGERKNRNLFSVIAQGERES